MAKAARIPGTKSVFSYRIPFCHEHKDVQMVKFWYRWICRTCVLGSLDRSAKPLPGRKQNEWGAAYDATINRKARRAG